MISATNTAVASCSKPIQTRAWVRKYITRVDTRAHTCNVCKEVLQLPPYFEGIMRQHFKSKHPFIYAKEKHPGLDSYVEDERKEGEDKEIKTLTNTKETMI